MGLLKVALCDDAAMISEAAGIDDDLSSIEESIDSQASTDVASSQVQGADHLSLEQMTMCVTAMNELLKAPRYDVGVASVLAGVMRGMSNAPQRLDLQSQGTREQHQLALEEAMDWVNRIFQQSVVHWKHSWNATTDFFRGLDSKVSKYQNKLMDTDSEYRSKATRMSRNGNSVALNELWYFFSNEDGQMSDISSGLSFDVNVSKYVLMAFPDMVIGEMNKLASIISGAHVKDEKSLLEFVKKIEALKTSYELFDKKSLKGKPLFNVTGFQATKGKRWRSAPVIADKMCDRLAEMAQGTRITETGSYGHMAKKAGYFVTSGNVPIVAIGELLLAKEIKYGATDVAKVIEFGQKYLQNIADYGNMSSKYDKAIGKLISSLEKLDVIDTPEGTSVMAMLSKIITDYNTAFTLPAKQEVARSLRGAKYCNYLALRMIYNAT